MLVIVALTWDPAALSPLSVRIGTGLGLVVGFFGLMLLLRHEEVVASLRRLFGSAPTSEAVDNSTRLG